MRASFHTIGCRLNQAETAVLAERLKRDGYQLVEFGRPTDLFVLNTCSVTEHAEADCRYVVRRVLRTSPDAFVAVTGCYAQTGTESLRRMPGIDLIVGAQYKMNLPDYLPAPAALQKRPAPALLHTRTVDRDDFVQAGVGEYDSTRANLKIQDGCNFMCSFCIIPFARGHERSRVADDVVREAEALIAKGHQELVLTGVNIGRYSYQGWSLMRIIERLERLTGLRRIRISSIEPTTIPDELLEYMATSTKLCPYLHIPLQSGDDEILRAMHRRYTVQEYRAGLEKALRLVPNLTLGTDVMVGFPGESDRQFENTKALVADLPFAYFHVFSFSKRPGTAAAKLTQTVHSKVIKRRATILCDLSRAKRLAFAQQFTGGTVNVLFEGQHDGFWTGLTDRYLRVGVRQGDDLTNTLLDVKITGVMDGLAVGQVIS